VNNVYVFSLLSNVRRVKIRQKIRGEKIQLSSKKGTMEEEEEGVICLIVSKLQVAGQS